MFNVYIATRSDDVYHNEKILVDLDKDFKTNEVILLLNGGQVPYIKNGKGEVIEWCFINEKNVDDIKTHYANFEERRLLPVIKKELRYIKKDVISEYYAQFFSSILKDIENVLKRGI